MVRKFTWSVPVAAVLALTFCVSLFAQRAGTTMMLFERSQANEIAQQIEEGQVNLAEAIKLAEKEGNGKALQAVAKFEIGATPGMDRPAGERPGQDRPGQPPTTTPPGQKPTAGGGDLTFEVVVFANNQLTTYHVDGKTREAKQFGTRVDLTKDKP